LVIIKFDFFNENCVNRSERLNQVASAKSEFNYNQN